MIGSDSASQDRIHRSAHSSVAQESRAAREDLLIGSLNVSMGADDSGHFAIEKSAQRNFFARGFAMSIDDDVQGFAAHFRDCMLRQHEMGCPKLAA